VTFPIAERAAQWEIVQRSCIVERFPALADLHKLKPKPERHAPSAGMELVSPER